MANIEVGDYFVKESGESYEVIDTIPERSEYICVRYDKNNKLIERDIVLSSLHFYVLRAIHSVLCVQFTFPETHQKLLIPEREMAKFEYSAYMPECFSVGNKVILEAIFYPKAELENLREFEG